jgi:hypothetical protein
MALLNLRPLSYTSKQKCPGCSVAGLRLEEDIKNQVVVCTRCKSEFVPDPEYGILACSGPAWNARIVRLLKLLFLAWLIYMFLPQVVESKDILPQELWYLLVGFTGIFFHGLLYSALKVDFVEFLPPHIRADPPGINMQLLQVYVPVVIFWFLIITAVFYR